MKNKNCIICIAVIAAVMLLSAVPGCRNHAAPTDPSLSYTDTVTSTATLTPICSPTMTSTVTPMFSPTHTATQGTTVTPGYRLKNIKIYMNSVLMSDANFSYASGCTPTSLSQVMYDSLGNITNTAQVQFDVNGNTQSATIRDANNNIITSVTSDISGGRVTKRYQYDGAGTLLAYTNFTYDAQGRVVKEEQFNGSGALMQTVYTSYMPNGSAYSQTLVVNGTPVTASISYTTDGNGNITRADMYVNSVLKQYQTMQYSATNKVTLVQGYDASGTLMMTLSYSYDGQDRISGMTSGGGVFVTNTSITYGGNGLFADITTSTTYNGTPIGSAMQSVYTWEQY